MTVPHLRKLLEDDVEDLAKRATFCTEVLDRRVGDTFWEALEKEL